MTYRVAIGTSFWRRRYSDVGVLQDQLAKERGVSPHEIRPEEVEELRDQRRAETLPDSD